MGDMTSGGAPRIKSIVAAIQTVANAVLNGNVRTNLRRDDGTEIGTSTNPLVVDIGGDVPDTMDVTKIGGNAVASGSGVADAGTLRVAVATDDVNLAGILAQLDITQSALRDALKGAGGKDFSTLETDIEAILATADVALSTRATEATLAAQLDITQSALRDAIRGAGGKDLSTLETDIESILAATDVALSTRATEATLAAQLDITQSALRDALKGIGGKDLTTLQTALDAVETAIEAVQTSTDVALSTRASEATLAAQLDITQSALRDAIRGAGGKDLSTLETDIESILAATDVALSTRASEATLAAQLDITQSALRDAIRGASTKDLTTLQTALDAVKTAVEKIDDLQDATVAEGAVPTKGIQISLDNGTDTQFAQCDANGYLKTTLQTAVPAGTNEIGGVNQTKVAGAAVSVNSGVLDAGTQRVAIATDDVNLSAIKTAAEKIDDIQDVIVAEGGVATKGVQICLDDGVDTQFAQCDASGNLSVNLQTAIPAGTNEIGGVDVVKVAGAAPSTAGKIDVLVADGDDVALGATTDVAVAAGAEGTLSAKLRLVTSQLADAVTALQAIDDWDSGDQCKVTPTAMGYVEANGDGTTADAYAAAATIDMRAHNQLKLLLANTDAANSLDYKVVCYAKHGGALSVDEVTETAAAAGAVAEVTLTEKWAQVVVQVKSTVAGTPATYAYEYIQSVM